MPDVTASYGKSLGFVACLRISMHRQILCMKILKYAAVFMYEVLYLHQAFTDWLSD